ncbi:hypothetical protein LXL04_002121 [Taraxacum kok-saghyz]
MEVKGSLELPLGLTRKRGRMKQALLRFLSSERRSGLSLPVARRVTALQGTPCITDCVMAELEKLGQKYRVALRNQMVVQKLIVTRIMGVVFGYFIGVSFPSVSLTKVIIPSSIYSPFDVTMQSKSLERSFPENLGSGIYSIYVPSNPRGAESLPPGIVVPKLKAKYLVTFTVGWGQRDNIDKSIKKDCLKVFSGDFQIFFFHYDGVVTEWDQYEWSKKVVRKEDEDLDIEHFNADKYFSHNFFITLHSFIQQRLCMFLIVGPTCTCFSSQRR